MIAKKLVFLCILDLGSNNIALECSINVLECSISLQDMHFPDNFSLVMKTSKRTTANFQGPRFGRPDPV